MIAYRFDTTDQRHAIGDDGPWQHVYRARPALVWLPPPVKGGKRGRVNRTYVIGPSERAEPRAFCVEKRR